MLVAVFSKKSMRLRSSQLLAMPGLVIVSPKPDFLQTRHPTLGPV
jgi:hypothetical protein